MKNKILSVLSGILAVSVCVNGFAGSAIVYADESSDFGVADIQHDNRTAYLERYGEYFDIFHCVADFSDGKTVYSYLVKEKTDIDNIVPEDGFELTNVKELETAKPILKKFTGWKTVLKNCRSYMELPENARAYIKFIEDYCETPVTIVSVGYERNETFVRKDPWIK